MNCKIETKNIPLEDCPEKLRKAVEERISHSVSIKALAIKQQKTIVQSGEVYVSYQAYLECGNLYTELHYSEDTEILDVNYMNAGSLFEFIKCGGPLIEMVVRDALAAREKENPPAIERQAGNEEQL